MKEKKRIISCLIESPLYLTLSLQERLEIVKRCLNYKKIGEYHE